MPTTEVQERLAAIPNLHVTAGVPLARYTRFGIGGPADTFTETDNTEAFIAAVRVAQECAVPLLVLGGGTNLVVADEGYCGVVLRYTASALRADGSMVYAEAGAELEALVDFTIEHGLRGIETLKRIPGSVGAAVYGNAGAYGHSISERVSSVRFFDGSGVRNFDNGACEFTYRESIFKRRKDWIVFGVELSLEPADPAELARTAKDIQAIRDEKFPVTMKCAGSIFKNLLLAELPSSVVSQVPPKKIREGKVPAAYFLEQVGAKGMIRGGIRVADYHSNLIYNTGGGTARELRELIADLKSRVRLQFGLELEEEIQYAGFE